MFYKALCLATPKIASVPGLQTRSSRRGGLGSRLLQRSLYVPYKAKYIESVSLPLGMWV